jgi:hypothetical protein
VQAAQQFAPLYAVCRFSSTATAQSFILHLLAQKYAVYEVPHGAAMPLARLFSSMELVILFISVLDDKLSCTEPRCSTDVSSSLKATVAVRISRMTQLKVSNLSFSIIEACGDELLLYRAKRSAFKPRQVSTPEPLEGRRHMDVQVGRPLINPER